LRPSLRAASGPRLFGTQALESESVPKLRDSGIVRGVKPRGDQDPPRLVLAADSDESIDNLTKDSHFLRIQPRRPAERPPGLSQIPCPDRQSPAGRPTARLPWLKADGPTQCSQSLSQVRLRIGFDRRGVLQIQFGDVRAKADRGREVTPRSTKPAVGKLQIAKHSIGFRLRSRRNSRLTQQSSQGRPCGPGPAHRREQFATVE
jgi:hypothetical protein